MEKQPRQRERGLGKQETYLPYSSYGPKVDRYGTMLLLLVPSLVFFLSLSSVMGVMLPLLLFFFRFIFSWNSIHSCSTDLVTFSRGCYRCLFWGFIFVLMCVILFEVEIDGLQFFQVEMRYFELLRGRYLCKVLMSKKG